MSSFDLKYLHRSLSAVNRGNMTMPSRNTVPPEVRKSIRAAKRLIEDVARDDGNEAETRRRVERVFESVMGYDPLKHLSREHAISGAGPTEHVDFVIQLEAGPEAPPLIMVELKRVGIDVSPKHLRQASSYAINAGCEWVLLTNGRQWRLYHVEFGQPPVTRLVEQWDLLKDELPVLAAKFRLISFKSLRGGLLKKLWERTRVLAPESMLAALFSAESLRTCRRILRKKTGVLVGYEDVVSGIQHLLNEAAAKELAALDIYTPERRKPGPKPRATSPGQPQEPTHTPLAEADEATASPQAPH
ncbi:MAG: type I restriction enzyme HsdR N-terminal domain-containing protein, partial [Candidatus Brocadiae bacterium]|nr:type I restriction enzyme HsdR N-terminal domain-containing protein [Candidatus Brocadiia bacterium]